MSNLKEIRDRIISISSTMQITNAMKMVSAIKLKKSQSLIHHVLNYANKLEEIFYYVYKSIKSFTVNQLFKHGASNKVLFIIISTNRGLCGSFNSLIMKRIQVIIKEKYLDKTVEILALGNKVADGLMKLYPIFQNKSFILNNINLFEVNKIINDIIVHYYNNKFYEVILVYNKSQSLMISPVIIKQLLPIQLLNFRSFNSSVFHVFEPNQEIIIEKIISKLLTMRLYKALLYSQISENKARMIAMHQATENAKCIKESLILEYNKVRQSVITKEILEIISGAKSLIN